MLKNIKIHLHTNFEVGRVNSFQEMVKSMFFWENCRKKSVAMVTSKNCPYYSINQKLEVIKLHLLAKFEVGRVNSFRNMEESMFFGKF